MDIALEARSLRDKCPDLEPGDELHLAELEDLLSDQPENLAGLSEADSDDVWDTAHKTGDPLADFWEWQISQDIEPDFDLTEVPEGAYGG